MLKYLAYPFVFPLVIALGACATYPGVPSDGQGQAFQLERDLAGATIGKGSFRAINGTNRGFTAKLHGTWSEPTFTLVEDFFYDDGETDKKTWVFTRIGENRWTGTREDVIGEAVAVQEGQVFRMEYKVALGADDDGSSGRVVKFRDVLYKDENGIVRNSATVGLYGIKVGSVDLTIERSD